MEADRALDVFAGRQYGIFSLSQARTAGRSDDMLYRRVRSGAWIRLAPKVYTLASAPPRWERQLAAAVLSRTPAIVSGPSAACLLRFNGFRPGRPEITVPVNGNTRSPIARVVRSKWFDELGTVRRAGFVVTSPTETLLSLAASLPVYRMEWLVDEALAARPSPSTTSKCSGDESPEEGFGEPACCSPFSMSVLATPGSLPETSSNGNSICWSTILTFHPSAGKCPSAWTSLR